MVAKPKVKRKGKLGKKNTEPPKKRGRPSKADIAAKEAQKLAEENALKEKIRNAQQGVPVPQPKKAEPIPVVTYPIFKVGERVQQVDGVLIPTIDRSRGEVMRQDLGSVSVFVAWDDGCKYWTHAICLELEPQKVKKTRAK